LVVYAATPSSAGLEGIAEEIRDELRGRNEPVEVEATLKVAAPKFDEAAGALMKGRQNRRARRGRQCPFWKPAGLVASTTARAALGLDLSPSKRREELGPIGLREGLEVGGLEIEAAEGRRLRLDSQAVEGHRQHLVVADHEAQLDQFELGELGGEKLVGPATELASDTFWKGDKN
jgi:hypothetical protein